jgi:hypothetical protein
MREQTFHHEEHEGHEDFSSHAFFVNFVPFVVESCWFSAIAAG